MFEIPQKLASMPTTVQYLHGEKQQALFRNMGRGKLKFPCLKKLKLTQFSHLIPISNPLIVKVVVILMTAHTVMSSRLLLRVLFKGILPPYSCEYL